MTRTRMNSFIDIEKAFGEMPPRLGALLSKADEAKGRFGATAQPPRLLGDMASSARLESVWAACRLAGSEVTEQRVERLIGEEHSHLRNRGEREAVGYCEAFDALTSAPEPEQPALPSLLTIHRRLFAQSKSAGGRLRGGEEDAKRRRGEASGGSRLPAAETPALLRGLFDTYAGAGEEEAAHPLLLSAALALDLLSIRPFERGNGRVARLLLLSELLRRGYGVARYTSIEALILERREGYAEALSQSGADREESERSLWPWASFLVSVLLEAQRRFEDRAATAQPPKGTSKQEWVRRWVLDCAPAHFLARDARKALPGISEETIRLVLQGLRDQEVIWCDGSGPTATWHKIR